MNNITPGTPCLIVGCNKDPSYVGCSGIAEHLLENYGVTPLGLLLETVSGGPAWVVRSGSIASIRKIADYVMIEPHHLMPIPPLAEPTATKQEEEKPCTA